MILLKVSCDTQLRYVLLFSSDWTSPEVKQDNGN